MYNEHLSLLQITAERLINELNWVLLLIESKISDVRVYKSKYKQIDALIDSKRQLVSLFNFKSLFACFYFLLLYSK